MRKGFALLVTTIYVAEIGAFHGSYPFGLRISRRFSSTPDAAQVAAIEKASVDIQELIVVSFF